MHRQIGILVSAMILGAQLGSPSAAAEPTTDQLRIIASLLSNDDYAGLRVFLRGQPDLLVEDTTLSSLLREFVAGSNQTTQGLNRDLSDALSRFSSQNSDTSDSLEGPGSTGASQY